MKVLEELEDANPDELFKLSEVITVQYGLLNYIYGAGIEQLGDDVYRHFEEVCRLNRKMERLLSRLHKTI